MRRRDFLKNTAAGIVLPTIAGGLGFKTLNMSSITQALKWADATDNVLVMIYLAGGNDGLNTIIPLDQLSNLSKVRPHVILPEDKILKINNKDIGFHPSMQELKDLYEEDRLAIVQNVGYPNPDYSHFRSTDIWLSGSSSDEFLNTGWTGRYLEDKYQEYPQDYPNQDMPDPLAIEIGSNNSVVFQGSKYNMGLVIHDPENFYELLDDEITEAPDTKAGERLEYVRLIARQSQIYGAVVKEAAEKVTSQGNYPDSQLAQKLKICARLIAGGLKTKLYLVEIGGFDTHDSQVVHSDHTKGEHADLLDQTSSAIAAFMKDLDGLKVSDRVVGMTFSEFGRRVVSNASLGTDHGTTAPVILFGNHVNAGIIGANPQIPGDAQYWYNLDLEFDFRQIYASLLVQWLCVPDEIVQNILFKDFDQIPLIHGTDCSPVSTSPMKQAPLVVGKVFPNPVIDYANVEFDSMGGVVHVQVYDSQGRLVAEPIRQTFASGKHIVGFTTKKFKSGTYFVRIINGNKKTNAKLIKL